MGEHLLSLLQRREALERAVFEVPPTDWADFQRRLGRYQELSHLIDEIQGLSEDKEKDV